MTLSSSPIFVVGTPRSGTTLTARILGNHPAIFMPGETHFIEDVYSRRYDLGDPADEHAREHIVERLGTLYGRFNEPADQRRIDRLLESDGLAEALGQAATYRDLFDVFMNRQMTAEGRRRWGNQVPRDLFELDQLLAFYPDARVIACVRDLRDYLLSYRDRWKAGSTVPGDEERLRKLYDPILTSMLWRSGMAALDTAMMRYGEHIFVNRYEALVNDPVTQVKAICAFVGEEFVPLMLDVGSYASSAGNRDRKIFASSVGRWRGHLPPADIAVAQCIGAGYMAAFGYPSEPAGANPLAVVRVILRSPYRTLKAIAGNKRVRGPLLPYLVRRLGKLFGR